MNKGVELLVKDLAGKYGFNVEEALQYVGCGKEERSRAAPARVSKRRIPLPWTGKVRESGCKALCFNLGLFTQCENEKINDYCEGCDEKRKENNGMLAYGSVEDRLKETFSGAGGKGVISYGNVLSKKKISHEEAKKYAGEQGVEIPEEAFIVEKKKRGRPKKVSTEVDDTSSDGEKPKKRGRPRKTAVVVEDNPADLIKTLVAEARKPRVKIIKKVAAVESLLAAVESPPVAVESPPAAVESPPAAVEQRSVITTKNCEDELTEEADTDSEEEEELVVHEFTHAGKTYLRTDKGILYDPETEEAIGTWDEDKTCVKELDD